MPRALPRALNVTMSTIQTATSKARLSLPSLPIPGRPSRDWLLPVRKYSLAITFECRPLSCPMNDGCFGTMIWRYEKSSCSSSSSLRAYQQIYKGDSDVRIRNNATSKSKYEGSILTVHLTDQQGVLPKSFGLALHHKTSVCGQPAYQSNIELVVVLILRNTPEDNGVPINHKIALCQPHLTSFKTVASCLFIEDNDCVDDLTLKRPGGGPRGPLGRHLPATSKWLKIMSSPLVAFNFKTFSKHTATQFLIFFAQI